LAAEKKIASDEKVPSPVASLVRDRLSSCIDEGEARAH
jgi:hypothetical protein